MTEDIFDRFREAIFKPRIGRVIYVEALTSKANRGTAVQTGRLQAVASGFLVLSERLNPSKTTLAYVALIRMVSASCIFGDNRSLEVFYTNDKARWSDADEERIPDPEDQTEGRPPSDEGAEDRSTPDGVPPEGKAPEEAGS